MIHFMKTAIVIISYNRPNHLLTLLNSLLSIMPRDIHVFVDGPKLINNNDEVRNAEIRQVLYNYQYINNLKCNFNKTNVGLRNNVVNAVTQTLTTHDACIVLEDDCIINKAGIDFCDDLLNQYQHDEDVAFISPFNPVPQDILKSGVSSRISIYPESYAWATWKRAWKIYSNDIDVSLKLLSIRKIHKLTGSLWGALYWKLNFLEAKLGLIDTWAYRWIACVWSNDKVGIISNFNYVKYTGRENGTHTRLKMNWVEPPVTDLYVSSSRKLSVNVAGEAYMNDVVFKNNLNNLFIRVLGFCYKFFSRKRFTLE